MTLSLPDVPRLTDPGLYELLQAMRRQVVENSSKLAEALGGAAAAGDAGAGERDPPSFVIDYGSSFDSYDADADAKDVYIRSGDYTSARTRTQFNKHMDGMGTIILPDRALPANYGYMAAKPTTFANQGITGWFRGDQWFTDGGEWKVIGANVRTYDITARYFESNVIPHHAWLDIESGNSGIAGYITAGITPGNSVNVAGGALPEWIGKQCQLKASFGGAVLATLTVANVAGSTVQFTTSHGVTYAWDPVNGKAPNLSFAPRTWNGHRYLVVRAGGGGDNYGDIVRITVTYQPRGGELQHTYNAMTAGQYGGSIDFAAGTSGNYATGWESQYNDQNNDVSVVAQVDSFGRQNDRAAGGGRAWIGTLFKSVPRAADAAHVVSGMWRRGLDTAGATMVDGTTMVDPAVAGAAGIKVQWLSGARVGYPIWLADAAYQGNVVSINTTTNVIQVTPNLNANYPANTRVDFPLGGAAVAMKLGQWINWDASVDPNGRAGDPTGVWGPLYSNKTGNMWTGTEFDGTRWHWTTYVGAARLRLSDQALNCSVAANFGLTLNVGQDLVTNGSTISGSFQGALVFGSGQGEYVTFNVGTGKYEFYINGALVFSIP